MTKKEMAYNILALTNLSGIRQKDFEKTITTLTKDWWLKAVDLVEHSNDKSERATQMVKIALFKTFVEGKKREVWVAM